MGLDRRSLLGLAGAGLLAGCGALPSVPRSAPARESASCAPRSALSRQTALADLPLVYEVDGRRSAFWFDPGFHDQLDRWLPSYLAASGLGAPTSVRTYGSWIDGTGSCDSWHHNGRAFDLASLRAGNRELVSCRYDRWRDADDADDQRRRYWGLAASLHRDFAYVLTYLYDEAHHNHIHVDNGRSGSGLPTFSPRSGAQVQAVQAMITHLWDVPIEISGRWSGETARAVRDVLDGLGIDADLDADPLSWQGFLDATVTRSR